MASRKTLTAANLQALGAERLAALLMEVGTGSGPVQRRLRLALAGHAGAGEAARTVGKRLAAVARGTTWLDWRKIRPFVAELDSQRRAILDLVAPADPREAFDLMWRLASCAGPVLARSDDGSGRLAAAFGEAVRNLGPLAQRAGTAPEGLAALAARALAADRHGSWGELVPVLAPALGTAGLRELGRLMEAWRAEPVAVPPGRERRVVGWSPAGPLHADEVEARRRRHAGAAALRQVADALGDVDGFIAQFDAPARRTPAVAAAVAQRLLGAERLPEAWAALEAVETRHREGAEWDTARLLVLEALGRDAEAQAFRWARFLLTLDAGHLRAFLAKLPDFDDFEAEQRALDHAGGFADVHAALAFLVAWPDLHRASVLVLDRTRALDGDRYEVLSPAADALDGRHPLAATLLRRAMVGSTLRAARAGRYKHAARHLAECRAAAARVADFGREPDHPAFEQALRTAHGRKAGFWQEVAALDPS